MIRIADFNPVFVFDLKFQDLSKLVEFIYKGELTIEQEELDGFMLAVDTLQVKGFGLGSPVEAEKVHNDLFGSDSESSASSDSSGSSDSPVAEEKIVALNKKRPKKKPTAKARTRQIATNTGIPDTGRNCQFCGNQYKSLKIRLGHQYTCSKNPNRRVFQCQSCPVKFTRKYRLSIHEKSHLTVPVEDEEMKTDRK